ncbi:phage tail tape measure protein [Peterkaempfera griseoplana]|uniref:phage tail tape measure protein n=1 Tax=Peterkaempfera griseoplana TaxID=66896 RepID=UPI0006E1CEEB|nr:phage tail tape measure protein [Peterkaempfera griseoplana]
MADIADLLVHLRAETIGFSRGMAQAARDGEGFTSKMGAAGAAMTKLGKGMTVIGLGGAVVATKMAGDFQQKMNLLVTACGEAPSAMKKVSDGVLSISRDTGTSWQNLAEGAYQTEKAGYRASDMLTVLKAAAQGAAEEGASLKDVTNAMTSVMASYHLKASDSVRVMNALKTAAGEGKMTMEEFASSLSTVIPIASANKISFAEVGGAIATLTQHGTSAREATHELANTIRNLAAPNNVAVKEMQRLGLSSQDVSTKLGSGQRGLKGTIDLLSETVLSKMGKSGTVLLSSFNSTKQAAADANTMVAQMPKSIQNLALSYAKGSISLGDWRQKLKGLPPEQANLLSQYATLQNKTKGFSDELKRGGPAAQTYTDAMKKMLGGSAGLNTALQLGGENADGFGDRIKKVGKSLNDGGKDVEGWASTQKTFNNQMARLKQTVETTAITIGLKLIPIVQKIIGFFSEHKTASEGLAIAIGVILAGSVLKFIGGALSPLVSGLGLLSKGAVGAVGAVGRLAGGFRDAQVAQSAFSGKAGTIGGILRKGFDAAKTGALSAASGVGTLGKNIAAATKAGAVSAWSGLTNGAKAMGGAMKTAAIATLDFSKKALVATAAALRQAAAFVAEKTAALASAIAEKAAAAAQWLLNIAMDANPIDLIIMALVALGAAFVVLWKKSQTFREIVVQTFVWLAIPVLEFAEIALNVVKQINSAFLSFASGLLGAASRAFSWVPGLGPKLKGASQAIDGWKASTSSAFDGAISKVNGWEDSVKSMPQKIKLRANIDDLSKKISDAKRQLSDRNLPPEKRAKLLVDISNWEQQITSAKMALENSPDKKKAILTAQITDWVKQIDTAKKALSDKNLPPSKKAVLKGEISDLQKKVAQARTALASVQSRTVTVSVRNVISSMPIQVPGNALGSVVSGGVRRMAAGGFGRPAMMARGGSNILWGEGPDESYIPHTRTPRSRAIAEQTVGILGGSVSWGGSGRGASGAGGGGVAALGGHVAEGLWQGMKDKAGWLAQQARTFALSTIPQPIADALGIKSPSKVAATLGRWVGAGMVQGLTGSTASVKSATLKLTRAIQQVFRDDARAQIAADQKKLRNLAGVRGTRAARERADIRADLAHQKHVLGASSSITKLVARDNAKLLQLAGQRDTVAKKLKAAQQKLADLKKSWSDKKSEVASGIMSGVSVVTDANEDGRPLNANDVLSKLRDKVQKATQFAALLKQLKSKGLRADLIDQIAESGADQGYDTALALAGGSKSQIAAVNQQQKNLVTAANSTGTVVADAMYGAGIKSAEGLVKGLQSQQKAIEAQMLKIARAMQTAIKHALGIKSPSRVMAELGDFTAKGLAVGIDRSSKHATIAAAGMAMSVRQAAHVTATNGRLAVSSNLAATAGGSGGHHIEVHIHVAGSVLSERQLRDVVEKQMLQLGMRNSRTYSSYQR